MEKEEEIRVVVRARPFVGAAGSTNTATNSRNSDKNVGERECIAASPEHPGELLVYTDTAHKRAATFRCETFLPSTSSQEDVFDQVRMKELVASALDGFPVTIFAYGQTGAGKSFTIFGQENGATERKMAVQPQDGLLPRTAQELMLAIAKRKGEVEYTLRVTCVEIYNEQVRDVFDPRKETLAVRSSKKHGFFLENATVVECVTAREIVRVVKTAATHRAKSSHLLNERSNRSHCLVTIYIDAAPLNSPKVPGTSDCGKRYGKITIVDLAGSERATDSGAVGTQLRETCHINRSLHCLSQVIQAMNAAKSSKLGKQKFIPYRDSKLTMLLLDSLGGNSKTVMLACVNASPQFATESVRTLEFAMGVAKIKNRPTALLNPHEKLIRDLKEQIRLLKLENMMLRARTPGYFLEHPDQQLESLSLPSSRADGQTDRLPNPTNSAGHSNQIGDSLSFAPRGESTTRRAVVQQSLQKLKLKARLRGRSKSPKKKILQRMSASFSDRHALPPVSQRAPPQRSLQYVMAYPGPSPPFHSADKVLPRTDSLPPGYDDLFGVETVPIPSQHAVNKNVPITQPPSNSSKADGMTATPLSPEEQLQQLLKQMLPQSTPVPMPMPPTTDSRPKILSKMANPHMATSSCGSFKANNNSDCVVRTGEIPTNGRHGDRPALSLAAMDSAVGWDDQRAQDLFTQLMQL